jgi:hypothetical protein
LEGGASGAAGGRIRSSGNGGNGDAAAGIGGVLADTPAGTAGGLLRVAASEAADSRPTTAGGGNRSFRAASPVEPKGLRFNKVVRGMGGLDGGDSGL